MTGATIVISDTHLTDKFDQKKFEYLRRIVTEADWVIVNGDFWDSELCTFNEFVRSPWKDLFPLLRSKGTIYIYGNHDPRGKSDARTALFSICQADSLNMRIGKPELHIEHGDRLTSDDSVISRVAHLASMIGLPSARILATLARIGLFLFGRFGLVVKEGRNNARMKRWARENLPESTILICGHTHLAEIDPEARFVNTGFIDCGYACYATIGDGEIVLTEERY